MSFRGKLYLFNHRASFDGGKGQRDCGDDSFFVSSWVVELTAVVLLAF